MGWSNTESQTHGGYLKWKEYENSKPVNFGKYIGDIKGANPGAENAISKLTQAHNGILDKIYSLYPQRNKETLKNFENFLNEMFFPADDGKNDYVAKTFVQTLINNYNKVYSNKLEFNNFDFSKDLRRPNITIKEAKNIKSNVKQSVRAGDNQRKNAALKTLERQINELKALEQSLKKENFEKVENLFKSKYRDTCTAYDDIIEIFETGQASAMEETKGDWEKAKSTFLISKRRLADWKTLFDDRNEDKVKKRLLASIQEFDNFYETAMRAFVVTPSDYGNVLEYGLALLGVFGNITSEEEIAQITQKEINEAVKNVSGKTLVERGGNKHDLQYDLVLLADDQEDKKVVIERSEYHAQEKFGNLTFDFHSKDEYNIDTGEMKQAKMDVYLDLPEPLSGGIPYRISAKNWGAIDDLHDLGTTSLLRAIDRTTSMVDTSGKQEVLLNYIYVMQHPTAEEPSGRSQPGKDALRIAHKIAKESVILDIASGFSQRFQEKDGGGTASADTLVIMDRGTKRVLVLDLGDIIRRYVNSKATNPVTSLVLNGYDEYNIESAARTFRNIARTYVSYKDRDRVYVSGVKLFLESQKATVKLNKIYYSKKD